MGKENQFANLKSLTKMTTNKPKTKKKLNYICSCCGTEYSSQRNNFPVSKSSLYIGNNGFLTICKNCVEDYFSKLVEFYSGSEEKAIERCCQIFDWFYSDEAVIMIKNCAIEGKIPICLYPSKINILKGVKKGTTYIDTLKTKTKQIINEIIENEETTITKEDVLFFGIGYTPDEYEFLRKEYNEWSTRNECNTKSQEELYKALTLAQLSVRRAQEKGNQKEFTDALKALQDLMGSANLKPVQKEEKLVEQNTLGTLISKWEKTKPIPETKYKDIDNLKNYIETYFLGHICKLFNIENDANNKYSEEIEKYTVTRKEYEDEEIIINRQVEK